MAGWCLIPSKVEEFRKGVIDGSINPDDLIAMDSAQRRAFFAERFGEKDATELNRRLEAKLILKDQQAGLVRWAENVIAPPHIKRDLISRIERLDKVLNAESEQTFYKDLASYRLGSRVSYEQAQQIVQMANQVEQSEQAMNASPRRQQGDPPTATELQYGRDAIALMHYVAELKREAEKVTWADRKARPFSSTLHTMLDIPGATKGMRATLDNSAIFRQGWKVMFTNPKIWARNSYRSFGHLYRTAKGEAVMDEINAGILSDPNYEKMQKAGLDVMSAEEDFPTSVPEKIPGYRRLYKTAETAFTAFQHKNRADIFNKMLQIADKTGVTLEEQDLINVGRMVNSLTGRGHLGQLEKAGQVVNTVLFSPKFVKSHIDVLTQPFTGGASVSEIGSGSNQGSMFVRKQAAQNLAKIVLMQSLLLALAKAFLPDDAVELDPRSSDFGNIKLGKTRFDISGGSASLITLAARIVTGQSKSTTTGKISDLRNPKYGQQGMGDVIEDFFENKAAPIAQVAGDIVTQKTFEGTKPTVVGEVVKLVAPMTVENIIENYSNKEMTKEMKAASIVADMLGISANTYKPFPKPNKQPRTWKQVFVGGER